MDVRSIQLKDRSIQSVSDITREIKGTLERGFRSISVRGEISNFHRHGSGHLYFTLKDAHAQLAAVMFRGNAASLFFQPQNGMEVVCTGDITVYEPRGNYQMLVTTMQPKGEGALQVAFEALKRRLHAEGLFDSGRKRPLPLLPSRVALVTSPTGAAVRDMIAVMRRRNPSVEIVLVPVQVQGAGAADEIAAALDACNEFGAVDVVITGRGGGSIEDLWAFNEEVVARAIHRSRIPVVSAVGHEVDVTIADYVADLRAATPSVAAELVVSPLTDLRSTLVDVSTRMRKFVDSSFERHRQRIAQIAGHWVFRMPETAVQRIAQQIDDLDGRLRRAIDLKEERTTNRLDMLMHQVRAHDPGRILQRGYAIVHRDDVIVESSGALNHRDAILLQFTDGMVGATVQKDSPDAP
jgi:exodeoxyribonuclease VII large subunit